MSLTNPGGQTNTEGDLVSLTLAASDSADNPLQYTATNLPPGLTISLTTGVIAGTVDDADSFFGPYTVTVTATDAVDSSISVSQMFQWTVHPDVTLTNPGTQTNEIGRASCRERV